ncbi:DNA replication regulator SLD3-domain-containing protein [Ampelomyces quisqualis]|uniref:DNA replication regulator SLD3-domain-containing protein n=1 Tax=Ampelomyces quisqualis TaxID=50730 RepID=A0A6A5QAQ6_AMPQU|nr:DNA replication regulator SLD3-domain-containing protein [Ampelomyces quisqualis]
MSNYALQTKTMLQSVSNNPIQLLRVATTRDDPKPQLPSKRKREALCGLGPSNKPFTIKPYPDSPYDKPVTFKPVRVIGRSQLPLTFLDTAADESFATNSLFHSHIDVLESHDYGSDNGTDAPRVLIARYETRNTLYAIERVQTSVYSIRSLAGWIKEKHVSELWDPSNLQSNPSCPLVAESIAESGVWWQHAVVEVTSVERPLKQARMTMMRKNQATEATKPTVQQRFDSPATYEPLATNTLSFDPPEEVFTPPSPQEQLEALVQQYLDAVYMSKTSLAYFAKGPITRVRTAFTSPDTGAPPTHELVTFLRAMLLSPKASEKKYYEKLPTIIKALPPGSFSDEDQIAATAKSRKSKKKKKKKLKLSREGTYAHEEAIVKKWWFSDPSGDSRSEETVDQRIKRRIGDLRVRETLAQLTIMLEVIALEALSSYQPPPEDDGKATESQPKDESQRKPQQRKKKFDDIGLQLDLLLDKLSIWHATEEAGILDFDAKPIPQYGNADGPGKAGASDRLRDFCVEVIVPFYMNRLPEQALMINKKLGGPAHTSPPKRKAMKPPVISQNSGDTKGPETKKSRRSLARVATETMRRSIDRATPSLSRSATDSALVRGVKREGSEVPLSAIPFQRSPSRNNRRSVSQYRHLEGRELDLTTPSAAVTAKLKQKQRVEEDLKEAITALKKPNRGLAVGGYVDDVERRGLGPASRSRKQPNPVRKVVKDIQVTATPRVGRRTKDMVEQTPSHHHHHSIPNLFARFSTSTAPHSSDFCIHSSGSRQPARVPGTTHCSATARNLAQQNVAETPSKAPNTKAFNSGAARRTIFATPSKPNVVLTSESSAQPASHVFETPAKVIGSSPATNINVPPTTIVATPAKRLSADAEGRLAASLELEQELSIYAALGWDDDNDVF